MKKLTELTTKLLANTCSELATMEALLASSSAVMSEETLFFEPWNNDIFKCRLKLVKWRTTLLTLWSQLTVLNEKRKKE
jgi:hypothetical protein